MTYAGKIVRWIWFFVTLGLLGYGLFLALKASPPDALQGNMVRAFYAHLPNWVGASIFLPLNLAASLAYLYLRSRNPALAMKADSLALASAEMGVLYCTLGLISGSLWGREEWGIWWTWDARLTTTLVLWLIYVAYLMVRDFSSSADTATVCAVLAVFGFIDIPIVYMSTQWMRTQHPAHVFGGGPNSHVAASIRWPVLWNSIAWVAWGVLIVSIRYAAELRRQQLVRAETLDSYEVNEYQGVQLG
jgi:heme exporter protein C